MLHINEWAHWTDHVYIPDVDNSNSLLASEFSIGATGSVYSNGGYEYELISSIFAVHINESGVSGFDVAGNRYRTKPGDLFAFFPGQIYTVSDNPGTAGRYHWIQFAGSRVRDTLKLAGLSSDAPLAQGDYAEKLLPLLRQAADDYSNPNPSVFFRQRLAWEILEVIASVAGNRSMPPPVSAPAEIAKRLMDEEFTTGLNVDEIARRLGVTRITLFRQFQRRYHASPKEYLDRVRMNRARQLLRKSGITIRKVAVQCGYEDSHYFSRAYKHAFGVTPSEDRTVEDANPVD